MQYDDQSMAELGMVISRPFGQTKVFRVFAHLCKTALLQFI